MSSVNVVCQTWLLPLHNKSLNSHLICFSSQCSAGRALGPVGVQQNHRLLVTRHRAEKYICLSDSGEGHSEGATSPRSGVQN